MMTLALMIAMTVMANAMNYSQARNEALFLSDKMAYELKLTNAQYNAVYEINLDYMMNVNGHSDIYGYWWKRRNENLRYVLTAYQYDKYIKLSYFYRPLTWNAGNWSFSIYGHYDRNRFFNGRPTAYGSYRGGNNRGYQNWRNNRNNNWNNNNNNWNNNNNRNNNNNNRNYDRISGGNNNSVRFGNNAQATQTSTQGARQGSGHFTGRR